MNEPIARILVVEDEPKLAALIKDYLLAAGYAVETLANGLDVIPCLRAQPVDLVLLDLMLPGQDGIDICRELRRFSDVPLVMVTARVDEVDRLIGLELGADDYVCKPFSPRELVARVKAILRRQRSAPPQEQLAAAGLLIDDQRYLATLDGVTLELTPVEFRLLKTLASAPGRVFSRQRLLDHLYTDHRVVTDRTVDSHVKNLRRKMQTVAPDRDLIRSIYGVGYKFE